MKTIFSVVLVGALSAIGLSGCYIVPVGPGEIAKMHLLMQQANGQGTPQPAPAPTVKAAPVLLTAAAPTVAAATPNAAAPVAVNAPPAPMAIQARLYPMNEIASESGMVSGAVTNMMNGKGRLQLSYRGEPMIGEATRVANDQSKGVASAWGSNGSFMSCEYQMSSPVRGAGTCSFSDGARYQVHVGQ